MQDDVFGPNEQCVYLRGSSESFMCSCVCVAAQWRASQCVNEICESFVPSVRVVQVTGVTCSLHHHHAVIGQIAQVAERHLSELSVLVAVHDQRRDLEEAQNKIQTRC